MDAADRGKLLFKLADLVEKNAEELAALESLNCGKTITDSRGDMQGVVNTLRYYAGWADKIEGRTVAGPRQLPVVHAAAAGRRGRPDHPLELPAADAGLEVGPGPGLRQHRRHEARRADAADRAAAGRAGRRSRLPGRRDQRRQRLRRDGRRRHRARIPTSTRSPSPATSTPPRSSRRPPPTRSSAPRFELGGKSPNVIFADADLDEAVAGAFHAIYFHGGQCCTAGSRLFVEEPIRDEFVSKLAEKAKSRKRRRPARPQHRAGPAGLAGADGQDPRLRRARPEAGRQADDRRPAASASKGFFVEPTIFDDVKDDMAIARDEIFGPVVSVLPFKTIDEVVERANRTNYGLAAAIWTKDIDKAHLYAKRGQGRHGVGELLPRRRHHDPVRRLQDVRARAARTARRRWSTTPRSRRSRSSWGSVACLGE